MACFFKCGTCDACLLSKAAKANEGRDATIESLRAELAEARKESASHKEAREQTYRNLLAAEKERDDLLLAANHALDKIGEMAKRRKEIEKEKRVEVLEAALREIAKDHKSTLDRGCCSAMKLEPLIESLRRADLIARKALGGTEQKAS